MLTERKRMLSKVSKFKFESLRLQHGQMDNEMVFLKLALGFVIIGHRQVGENVN